MSYILDALRKADAQRERDPARGIHAQPMPASAGAADQARRDRRWMGLAAVVGIAVLAWAGWSIYQDRTTAPARVEVAARAPVPAPAAAPVSATVPAATPVATAVMPPPPPVEARPATEPPKRIAQADPRNTSQPNPRGNPQTPPGTPGGGPPASTNTMPPAAAQGAPAPVAPAVNGLPSPSASAVPSTAAPAASPTIVAPPVQPPQVVAPPMAPPPLPPPPPVPATPVTGLPADAPKVTISGGVYSANATQRMLIVNGQVMNEGAEVAPGLVLEEIRPKAAVLKFRGARYTVTY